MLKSFFTQVSNPQGRFSSDFFFPVQKKLWGLEVKRNCLNPTSTKGNEEIGPRKVLDIYKILGWFGNQRHTSKVKTLMSENQTKQGKLKPRSKNIIIHISTSVNEVGLWMTKKEIKVGSKRKEKSRIKKTLSSFSSFIRFSWFSLSFRCLEILFWSLFSLVKMKGKSKRKRWISKPPGRQEMCTHYTMNDNTTCKELVKNFCCVNTCFGCRRRDTWWITQTERRSRREGGVKAVERILKEIKVVKRIRHPNLFSWPILPTWNSLEAVK